MSKLEKALERYYEHFGENYPLTPSESRDAGEIIADIEFCIEKNEPESEPDYEDDAEY